MFLLDPNNVHWIVLHCSGSPFGDIETLEEWHLENGWGGCGYHYIITNVFPKYEDWRYRRPYINYDGLIWEGRSEKYQGAHVRGHNWETIGVCLIGEANGLFSSRQLESAAKLCYSLTVRFPNIIGVRGHYEFSTTKTCPEIDMEFFRDHILKSIGETDEDFRLTINPSTLIESGSL